MMILAATRGTHAAAIAEELLQVANNMEKPVGFVLNGTLMVACPGDDPVVVFQNWDTAYEINRAYYLNSPEGRKKRRQQLLEIIDNAVQELIKLERGDKLD